MSKELIRKPGGANRHAILETLAGGPQTFGQLLRVMYDQAEGGKPPQPLYCTVDEMIVARDLLMGEDGCIADNTAAQVSAPDGTNIPDCAASLSEDVPPGIEALQSTIQDAAARVGALTVKQSGTRLSWLR